MKEIILTRGKIALIDDEDYERVNQFKWRACRCGNNFYARTGVSIYMHRIISSAKNFQEVDHVNMNTLDNRKCNLRNVTHSENAINRNKKNEHGVTSKFKGVGFHAKAKKWMARIAVDGKRFHLGLFDKEVDAAIAYKSAAKRLHGEYARF